jgi:beta-lactamase class D
MTSKGSAGPPAGSDHAPSSTPSHMTISLLGPWIAKAAPRFLLLAGFALGPAGCTAPSPEVRHPGIESSTDTDQGALPALRWEGVDLRPHFEGREATFVLLDPSTGETLVHGRERAETPFLPASTFKIPNTLMALEERVADGPGFRLTRDPSVAPEQPWWPASWMGDPTLEEAFHGSVVWYYQELARRLGPAAMEGWLDALGYGNGDRSAGIDRFWLEGSFGVSAMEQVGFLERFLSGALPVSPETRDLLLEFLLLEEWPGTRLSGKTGWVGFGDPAAPQLGWFVGYVERGDEVFPFALNLEMSGPQDAPLRITIARNLLFDLGLLPAM